MDFKATLRIEVQGDRELKITRKFGAPRDLIFDAHTRPEMIRKWMFGPDERWEFVVCDVDLNVGGKYKYAWQNSVDGQEMSMFGEFKEITKPEMLVQTEDFIPSWYTGESLNTITLVEVDGVTTLTCIARYENKESRDMVLNSPMESGLAAGYNRIDDIYQGIKNG